MPSDDGAERSPGVGLSIASGSPAARIVSPQAHDEGEDADGGEREGSGGMTAGLAMPAGMGPVAGRRASRPALRVVPEPVEPDRDASTWEVELVGPDGCCYHLTAESATELLDGW